MVEGQNASSGLFPLLAATNIRKSFQGVDALQSASLLLYPGEIVGLAGDNGAGKSTLIKILSGVYRPDSGSLAVDGKEIDFDTYNVIKARKLGVETVFQDKSMGLKQPLWRNVFVGRPLTNRLGLIRVQEEKRITLKILRDYLGLQGKGLDVDAPVENLSGGERQGLAIGRAMYFDARIVILDEPTTALSLAEVDKVLTFVRRLVEDGRSCIYISHNIGHIYHLADRIVVLDRGRVAAQLRKKDMSADELVRQLMAIRSLGGEGQS
jgi:simple sugar transport system ATP-binding protein